MNKEKLDGKLESWVVGMVLKRPETALVLHALLLRLREKGEVTAEDAHDIAVSHPNVRGTAMRLLRKCGAEKTVPSYGTTRRSHGHVLFKWTVKDAARVRAILARLGSLVTALGGEEEEQLLFDVVV